MSLLVTGGLGFLGKQVARHYLKRGTVWAPKFGKAVPLEQLTLFDVRAFWTRRTTLVDCHLTSLPTIACAL